MSDNLQDAQKLPPPTGDSQVASKYVDWLVELVNKDKVIVNHSDLSKFSVDCMEDHYRIGLDQYDIEVSHSKHPKSGDDIFTMIFNNLSQVGGNQSPRVILAYTHMTKIQFEKFKNASDTQIQRKWREAEDKRFKEAMQPIDEALEKISNQSPQESQAPETTTAPEESADTSPVQENIQTEPAIEPQAPLPEPMKLPPVPTDTPSTITEALNQLSDKTLSQLGETTPQITPQPQTILPA